MILNELFTGVVPHGTDYKKIGESAPEYGYLDRIVDACLRQERSNRPDSIEAIKRDIHIYIYGQEAVTLQKLSAIENRVVDESVIDDPLATHPIGLVGADWDANILTLELSQPVTEKWVSALINMGSYEAVWGKGPDLFRFRGNKAVISADPDEVQPIIDHFKEWLPRATARYRGMLREEAAERERAEQERIRQQRLLEEQRLRVLRSIKI